MRECLALSLFLLISGCKLSSQTQTSSSGNTQPQAPAVSLKSGELTNSAVAGKLDLPNGRNGLQPKLAITYRSTGESSWLGVGWEIEVGAIERATTPYLDYGAEKYVFRNAAGLSNLASQDNSTFYQQNEASFLRFRKLSSNSDVYWEITDKIGNKYLFGETSTARPSGVTQNRPMRVT